MTNRKNAFSRGLFRALLLLLALSVFSGCAGQGSADGTSLPAASDTGPDVTETAAAGAPVLVENGKFLYSYVRASDMSDELVSSVSATYRKLKEKTGTDVEYTDDFLMPGKTADSEKKEILIGATNRPESAAVLSRLRALDWFVGREGEKIVVCGKTDDATRRALSYFDMLCSDLQKGDRIVLEGLASDHLETVNYLHAPFAVAGNPASDYTVVCSTPAAEDSLSVSTYLNQMLSESTGDLLAVRRSGGAADGGKSIFIGSVNDTARQITATIGEETGWKIEEKGGDLYLCGRNSWALRAAVTSLVNDFVNKDREVPSGYRGEGDSMGIQIDTKTPGSTLRLMTNNVWNCNTNRDAWIAIGENCSAEVRSVGFARVYTAYMPDVINTQEMTALMLKNILKNMEAFGVKYESLAINTPVDDFTALIYNPETVTLEQKGHHVFDYGSDAKSKGYTWGYFKLNATGEHFVTLSTHMWWKSESAQEGSNAWREQQAAEIVKCTEQLEKKFGCPVFIQGDFNTQTTSKAFSVFIDGGFSNCQKIATVSTDDLRGYHSCSPSGFSTELSAGTYTANGIDHMLVRNLGNAEVLAFHHIIVDFYAKLSDHYPVYIDVSLGASR